MADDYDDYDERPPVPTFSDGSYSNKGAKSSANASRLSASKNAHAVASRASAMMAASMQQLKYSTQPILNSHQAVAPRNTINRIAIQAAEKRAQHMIQQIRSPEITPIPISAPPNIVKDPELDNYVPIYTAPEPVQIKEIKLFHTSDIYSNIVTAAISRKKLLLENYEHIYPKVFKNTKRVVLVQSSSPPPGEVDPSLISTLSTNLLNILNVASDNNEILDEFNRYTSRVRISLEEPIHKSAVEKARIIKNTYFTSDT
jgi:hypothetical protein